MLFNILINGNGFVLAGLIAGIAIEAYQGRQ